MGFMKRSWKSITSQQILAGKESFEVRCNEEKFALHEILGAMLETYLATRRRQYILPTSQRNLPDIYFQQPLAARLNNKDNLLYFGDIVDLEICHRSNRMSQLLLAARALGVVRM